MSAEAVTAAWTVVPRLGELLDDPGQPGVPVSAAVLLRLAHDHPTGATTVQVAAADVVPWVPADVETVKRALGAFDAVGLTRIVEPGRDGRGPVRELCFLAAAFDIDGVIAAHRAQRRARLWWPGRETVLEERQRRKAEQWQENMLRQLGRWDES